MSTVLALQDVSKRFYLRHNRSGELKVRFLGLFDPRRRERIEELWAVKRVSLSIGQGESVGLIGRNGSGKSTLLKMIAGIHQPTSGRILMARGARLGTLIELGVGFHPELTGAENVLLNASMHGLSRRATEALYPHVVEYSGLDGFMDVQLKNYSSGMQMRLGFAVAANLDPDILLLDEIFAVGDEDFQKQCQKTLKRFLNEGKTIVFVSHASASIRAICRRVCLLEHGEVLYDGNVDSGLAAYQRLMLSTSHDADAAIPLERLAPVKPAVDAADLDSAWHRVAVGGMWDEIGTLQFDFLRAMGLRPDHYFLDAGCGSLRAGVHLIPYLDKGHYIGLDSNQELIRAGVDIELLRAGIDPDRGVFVINDRFDLTGLPQLDFAIAHSLLPHVSLNVAAFCIAAVVRKLKPTGQFFVSYFENPDRDAMEPVVHPSGVTTYPDAEPYHTTLDHLAGICGAVGARLERIGEWGHPRGQLMLRVTRA